MKKTIVLATLAMLALGIYSLTATAQNADSQMSFFLTSAGPGDGANLGGLDGADAHCAKLAEAVGVTGKHWHAYLSTTGESTVHAKDRIGSGPWHNSKGVKIADNVAQLHGENGLTKETNINEKGEAVNGRGDTPNRHDIITGTNADGTAFTGGDDNNCSNWTGSGEGSARVGHHDRTGGGDDGSSWNAAHNSRGCSQSDLQGTGGDGLFYCFATE